MFTGVWIDTAIGVALFFLAMSFVVTAAVEALSQLMARAKTLRSGIDNLLQSFAKGAGSHGGLLKQVYDHSLIKGLAARSRNVQRPCFSPPSTGRARMSVPRPSGNAGASTPARMSS